MAERKLGHKFREDGVEWLVVVEFVMIVERILEVSIALHLLVHLSEDVGLVWFDELQQLAELYLVSVIANGAICPEVQDLLIVPDSHPTTKLRVQVGPD